MLQTKEQVQRMIAEGKSLFLAASAAALSQLPTGSWIGGSIPYFMDAAGGVRDAERIFVTELPEATAGVEIREYNEQTLADLYRDAPTNGFTFLLVPNEAAFLKTFAHDASSCEGFLVKPVVGWVSGVAIEEIGRQRAIVVDGRSQRAVSESALAMHVSLPTGYFADLEIVNIFKPGSGETITFAASGFEAAECRVNGVPANLAEYIAEHKIDTRIPLTANYSGSILNVSVQSIDGEAGQVHFYAPVFAGIEYRFASPVGDYAKAFAEAIPHEEKALFACNCILNYLYGQLEGHHTGGVTGPITFGEIAHQLLNQTLVQLRIHKTA
jgi:hypothetical protein